MEQTTLQSEWKKYRDLCYPKWLPADQNRELHQAFFASALVVLGLMMEASNNLPEDEAMKRVAGFIAEAKEVCGQRAHAHKARN